MNEVKAIKIIDGTPIGKWYEVGSPIFINPLIGMKKVSEINFVVSPSSKNVIIKIFVEGQLYCTYEGLPYNVYYKMDFEENNDETKSYLLRVYKNHLERPSIQPAWNDGFADGIKRTLEILGIKIKGIND